MIKFIYERVIGNDKRYTVELDREYTVREFIQTILTERKNEYGFFGSMDIKDVIFRCIPYKNSEITTDQNKYDYIDKIIKSVTANFGTDSRVDYWYKFK